MKGFVKYFVGAVLMAGIAEGVLWLSAFVGGYSVQHLDEEGVITVWAAVITLVFLVFSVLGLWTIDRKIADLDRLRTDAAEALKEASALRDNIAKETSELKNTASDAKRDIIAESRKEIKRFLNVSMTRQNLYDEITRIHNIPSPVERQRAYTVFIQNHLSAEGINMAALFIGRGQAFTDIERFDDAERDYLKAIELDPDNAGAYAAMGGFCVIKKDYEGSIRYFKEAVKRDRNRAYLYCDIANSLAKLNRLEEAREYYDKAFQLNPDLFESYYNRALLSREIKEDPTGEQAIRLYRHCLHLNPAFIPAKINLANTYREKGDKSGAISILNENIEKFVAPDIIRMIALRGIWHAQQQDFASAKVDLEHVLLFHPHDISALYWLGRTYAAMQFFGQAEEMAKKALQEAGKQNNHTMDADIHELLSQLRQIFNTLSSISIPKTNK